MPASSRQDPVVLCLFLEGHSWKRQAHLQRQKGENTGRVHKEWPDLSGGQGDIWEEVDAQRTRWDKMRPWRLRGQTQCTSGLSAAFLCGTVCGSRPESLTVHCMTLVQPRQGPSTGHSLYSRPAGCPFPAPGWLSGALEESCGGLKV